MIDKIFPNVDWPKMWEAALETLYMTAVSTVLTFIIGLALGLLLFLTSPHQAWANKLANWLTGAFVNIFRSIPFIILIILLIPLRISNWNDARTKCCISSTCNWSSSFLCTYGINSDYVRLIKVL